MKSLNIKVALRKERGRQNNKIRKNKRTPAVVYGGDGKNISLSLNIRDAEKYSQKIYENKIFTFESESAELNGLKALKKAVSFHKTSHRPIHMDFLCLDMSKPVRVPVDIRFTGVPKGVKEEGGVFSVSLRSVELECLPEEIPPSLSVDVSGLSLNQSLHVSDLKLSDRVKLLTRARRTLCSVGEAAKEEEKASAGEEGKSSEDKAAASKSSGPAKKS